MGEARAAPADLSSAKAIQPWTARGDFISPLAFIRERHGTMLLLPVKPCRRPDPSKYATRTGGRRRRAPAAAHAASSEGPRPR